MAAAEPEQRVKLKTRRKEESEVQALKREKKKKRKKKEKEAAVAGAPSVDEDSGALVIDEASSDSADIAAPAALPTTPKRDALAALLEQCAGSTTSTPSAPKPPPTAEDKKRRPWKNTVKTYYQLPLDSNGEPKLPILIGSMVIHSLGKIDPSDAFHAKRYIWPLGFRSTRPYGSMLDFSKRTEYTSEIKMVWLSSFFSASVGRCACASDLITLPASEFSPSLLLDLMQFMHLRIQCRIRRCLW